MGDAKRRGTFEERKAEAIAKQKISAQQKAAKRAEIESSKTPEQKIKKHEAMMNLMMLLGMAGAYRFPYKLR